MKKIILSVVLFSVVLSACKGTKKEKVAVKEAVEVENIVTVLNNVDVATSVITWEGTKPTGAHDGIISLKNGSLVVENGVITGGNFVIDMNTITNVDMKGSGGARKIEAHLKNEDFFDVVKYPASRFTITEVTETEGKLAVTGNLKVKDVEKSITIPAVLIQTDSTTVFKSDLFNIDRADFNITHKSKSFFSDLGDKFIDDLVEMSFEVHVQK